MGDRAAQDQQALRPGPGQPRHRPEGRARHDPRHRRRERGRQVDADVDPLRLLQCRQRRDPGQRPARPHPRFQARAGARHRHGAPALHAGRQFLHPRKRRARRRGQRAAGPDAGQGARPSSSGSRTNTTCYVDPDAIVERRLGRPAAARRNPQGALPRRRHPDPRRADRRADARPRPTICSASCAPCATRARRSS